MSESQRDLRPSGLDVDALLSGGVRSAAARRLVVDALQNAGLLYGGDRVATDATGHIASDELDQALADFDEATQLQVKSILRQVNALY